MIPQVVLDNFRPWATQVLLIGSIGALLPGLFRIRHPRSQLIYCHLVLLVSLILPVIQPWRHPVIVIDHQATQAVQTSAPAPRAAVSAGVPYPWSQFLLWVVAAGVALRLCWTLIGLWRIHQHKIASRPLYPVPESVRDASARVAADAMFCVSSSGTGPVTFGFFRPVVLLPESFFKLDVTAQCGVAC